MKAAEDRRWRALVLVPIRAKQLRGSQAMLALVVYAIYAVMLCAGLLKGLPTKPVCVPPAHQRQRRRAVLRLIAAG